MYVDHYDIDGNPINVITCSNCGNQERKEGGKGLHLYDRDMKCCKNPFYLYGVTISKNDFDEDEEVQ